MYISVEDMKLIHNKQLNMIQSLITVMNELNLKYYFVHGSLLGAVRDHDFILEDDDIDIALPRKDYNILMNEGNNKLSSNLFIQSSLNDDFPLGFAKLRANDTEFRQPILKNYNCHKGLYIDIFPIDYFDDNRLRISLKRILNIRICSRLNYKKGIKQKACEYLSLLLFPSYRYAVNLRESLYSSTKPNKYVQIFSGKSSESKMNSDWFGNPEKTEFCGMEVFIPYNFDSYLKKIYGDDYINHNPAEARISNDGMVEISADCVKIDMLSIGKDI